jgi:hypothetical protein
MPPPSPEDRRGPGPEVEDEGVHPTVGHDHAPDSDVSTTQVEGAIDDPPEPPDARTSLLGWSRRYSIPIDHNCGEEVCGHGTFSPRPTYHRKSYGYGSFDASGTLSPNGFGGPYRDTPEGSQTQTGDYRGDYIDATLGDAVTDGLLGYPSKKNTTHWLAKRHGVKHERLMYAQNYSHPLYVVPRQQHMLIRLVGFCFTTSPSSTGYGSTSGPTYKATLWLP